MGNIRTHNNDKLTIITTPNQNQNRRKSNNSMSNKSENYSMVYNTSELSRLVSVGVEDNNDDNKNQQHAQQLQQLTRWKRLSVLLLCTLLITCGMALLNRQEGALRNKKRSTCMFCHLHSQPTLYEDQSYSMLVQNNKTD